MDNLPIIAIVGRPNVGKSTLFNRIIGKNYSITANEAGTTRDRISKKVEVNGYEAILVDTGGLESSKKENIEADVQAQSKVAIEDADIIVFVLDSTENLTTDDFAAASLIRRSKKSIILVASKCEKDNLSSNYYNIFELGLGEPVQVSAIHKLGMENLEFEIEKKLKELKFKKRKKKKATSDIPNICILGKPNAGKSSLINSILGSEKIIVSDIPGTTRDTTDNEITFKDKKYNLIDTAGLRRKGRIESGIEKFSSLRTINAVENSDVVVLLIDGGKGITSQDCHIAQYALEAEKGLILAINKIDLFEEKEEERNAIISRLRRRFSFVPWAPVLFMSAKNKKNIYEIFELVDEIKQEREKRITTNVLNKLMQEVTYKHLPASAKIKKPKYLFANQVDVNPPKFVFFFKNAANLHFSYPRYLENRIREEYGFKGTPIHIKVKEKTS